jgi:hypothetical protein
MHVLIMSDGSKVLARERPAQLCGVGNARANRPVRRKKRMTEAINSLHATIQAGIYK